MGFNLGFKGLIILSPIAFCCGRTSSLLPLSSDLRQYTSSLLPLSSDLRQYTRSLVSVTAVSLKLLYFLCLVPSFRWSHYSLCLAPSCPVIRLFFVFGAVLSGDPIILCDWHPLVRLSDFCVWRRLVHLFKYCLRLAPSCPVIGIFPVLGFILSNDRNIFCVRLRLVQWSEYFLCLAASCPMIGIFSVLGSILSSDRNISCARLHLVQWSEYFLC